MLYLTLAQLENLQHILDQRELAARAQIRAEAGHRADEPYASLAGEVADSGDQASAALIVDIDNAMMSQQLAQLRDIEEARDRITRCRYGICVSCEQEIEYDRLLAYPTAKRCATCQGVYEKTFLTQAHSSM